MTTTAVQLPIAPTVAPTMATVPATVWTRASAPPADWSSAADFDAEKGTMGGYAQAAKEDLTFSDLIDLINPLQHIPGVSQVYRAMTGDTIKPAVKVAGGMLFGGPAGMLIGAGSAVMEGMLGDPIARVADAVLGTNSARTHVAAAQAAEQPAAQVADASPPAPPQALPGSGTQVAALADAPQDGPRAVPSPVKDAGTPPTAASNAGGPADIGAAGEATLAALIAASQAKQPSGAPQNGFDLAAYAGGGARPAADAAPSRAAAGKNIRSYLAEAVHTPAVVRRPPAEAKATEASATDAGMAAVPEPAAAVKSPEPKQAAAADDVTPATVAAKPGAPPVASAGPAVPPGPNQGAVPPWFADRVLQNLDRYGAARKTETKSEPASG